MSRAVLGLSLVALLMLFVGCNSRGPVTTIAGTGNHGAVDSDTDYGLAQFNLPMGVFGGENGELYVLDTYNNMIRIIDYQGHVSRFAGDILMDGDFPVLDMFRFPRGFHRDGPLEYALFNRPTAGAIDEAGRMFIVDSGNHAIRVIIDRAVYTFVGGVAGHKDGPIAYAMFYHPTALAIDSYGNLYIADTGNSAIRRIDTSGYVTTVAGIPGQFGFNDGPAEEALFNEPMGIAIGTEGAIFIADSNNHLIRVLEGGYVRTLAGIFQLPNEDDPYDEWDMLPIGGYEDGIFAMFNTPIGIALWGDNLIVADSLNHAIRMVRPCGEAFTIVGTGHPGHGDGFNAMLHLPKGVYIFGGELIITDTGNNMIRKMLPPLYLAEAILENALEVYNDR